MQRAKRAIPMHRERFSDKKLQCPPLAGFDFETKGLGGDFLGGSIWTNDGVEALFTDLRELFDWILCHPQYRYLAHNAVGYEFAYLAPLLYELFDSRDDIELHPTVQGDTRIVQWTITITDEDQRTRRGKPTTTKIDLRDTLCLFSMSLEKVADAFCPDLPKLKNVIDFEKEDWDINNPEHVAYVMRDSQIVVEAYEKHWNNVVRVFGSPLGVTAGSTALKAFKTTIPEGHVYYRVRKDVEEFIRECYYGGLVLPGHSIGNWGAVGSVDVNGAYAFQMAEHEYPVGTPFVTHRFHMDLIGFYRVRAIVPDSVFDTLGFNPIPRKDKGGLCWPSGEFETYITSPEILYAREKGCTVEVIEGYVFTKTEPIFREFVQKCQEMELAEGGVFKPSIKQIRNSGYGKFGAKETHKSIKFSRETLLEKDGYSPVMIESSGQIVDGLYTYDEESDGDYMLPHWAALITAYERLYLMKFMEEAYKRGAKNVYTDTDSIKCDLAVITSMVDDGFIPVGNVYGQFKVEEVCQNFYLIGGKCFYGDTGNVNTPLLKAKGIPKRISRTENGKMDKLSPDLFLEALENKRDQIWFVNVKSVMSIIKEKSRVKPIKRKRKITDIRNSYAWQIDTSGSIYPRGYQLRKESVGLGLKVA